MGVVPIWPDERRETRPPRDRGRTRRIRLRSIEVVPRVALTVEEAAEAMGVSGSQIRRWITAGHLATVPHTGRTLVAVEELRRFATSRDLGQIGS